MSIKLIITCVFIAALAIGYCLGIIVTSTEQTSILETLNYVEQTDERIFKLAMRHHNAEFCLLERDASEFVFYREGEQCLLFNQSFREYLLELIYTSQLEAKLILIEEQ